MLDPVIKDLNEHIKRMDDEYSKERAIEARVEELVSEGGDFYPWDPENMVEALDNIDKDSAMAINMAAYGELNNALRFFESAKQAIQQYWHDRATDLATASVEAEMGIWNFQNHLKTLK